MQLKSMNVPWITIQSKSYKSASSSPSKKNSPRQSNSAPATPERVYKPFPATNITFSREEMKLLDPEPEFRETMKIYRSKSKLLQLQNQVQEKEQEMKQYRETKKAEIPIPQPKPMIEKSDSFISVDYDKEDNFIKQLSCETLVKPKNEQIIEPTDDKAIKDLKNSVWRHCREIYNVYENKKVHEINGVLSKQTVGSTVNVKLSKGQRKVQRAIYDHSVQEENIFEHDQLLTPEELAEEATVQKDMADTYCGKKLRGYIEGKNQKPPRFLEDMEFSKNAYMSKPKQKMSSRFKAAKRPIQQNSNHETF